ncbi:MAG: hypothetical protein ACRDZU_06780 [Acidimicrobiales bacterium]
MTDSHDPRQPDDVDDLASAHLDGQTTDAEAARIAADPSLAERVADMAAVRAAVRSDGPAVDEERREAGIAAALAAFDDSPPHAGVDDEGGTLTPITAARGRRGVSRRTLQLVGAVAVAVLLALAVPLLGRLDSDPSEEDLATSALEESALDASQRDAKDGDAAAGTADPQAPSAGTYAVATDSPVELGTFADLDALEDAVRARPTALAADQAGPTTTVGPTAEAAGACTDAPGATPPDAGPRVLTGTATLRDRRVLVFMYERPTGERLVVVVDAAECVVVSSRAL